MKEREQVVGVEAAARVGKDPLAPENAVGKRGRMALLLGVSLLVVLLTRWPLQPAYLYSFDSINLALALADFDPTRNQPQPPGYPLFVLEARLGGLLLGTPEQTFATLRVLVSALSLALLFVLGRRMFSASVGSMASALLLVNPVFWFSGLTSPLRPHLALFSLLVAYCGWRAAKGETRYFYAASVALGLGGGFRPELSLLLLPLWCWSGWRCGRFALLWRGALLFSLATGLWMTILVIASGGLAQLLHAFQQYTDAQTFQTSALLGESSLGWRRMAGRAVIWTGLGALPWIWTAPFGWFRLRRQPEEMRGFLFLLVWFLPGFLFHLTIHIGDPDHALLTIPMVCLVGGVCVNAAEQATQKRWNCNRWGWGAALWLAVLDSVILLTPHQGPTGREFVVWISIVVSLLWLAPLPAGRPRAPWICVAMLGNLLLFFGKFPFPQGPRAGTFRGFASLRDSKQPAVTWERPPSRPSPSTRSPI